MKRLLLGLTLLATFSCAPVKFTKSDDLKVDAGGVVSGNTIACNPAIAPNLTTYTYPTSGTPSLLSNCTTSGLTYQWNIKKSDGTAVNATISGLTGANPANIDLRILGQDTYYIFLTATDPAGTLSPYVATTPLELVVPGVTGNSLTCDPKLNSTLTSVTLNASDSNATVTANCSPLAAVYIWTVTKDGVTTTIAGLSGESSTPDLKSYGAGTYLISLYATTPGSAHWQSSSPLTVVVKQTVTPPTPIACNPRINGSQTSLTVTSSSNNPLISANCSPSDGTYTWSVTKSGQPTTISGLAGANSNPDFTSLGTGTYLIYLTVTKSGYSDWNTTTPLTITVDTTGNTLNVNCAPRLNADSTAITITSATGNPTLNANCNPSNVTYTWSVYKNGVPVTINGIGNATSTPDFISAGLGTYSIYLNASLTNYNAYSIPTPLQVTVANAPQQLRHVTLEKTVQVTDNKVDILVVVDDSSSMLPKTSKLGQRLSGFVSSLTSLGIDWQMCATITNAQDVYNNGVLYWGASRNWVGYVGSAQWILKAGATDPNSIFNNTIQAIGAGWANTDDERAIKAAFWHAQYAQYNKCYRDDASLSVIIISDEDERSVGGDPTQQYYAHELLPLEADDLPANYVNQIHQQFGMNKRFTVNSIIVQPGDSGCMANQDAQGTKTHYGFHYDELSKLTNGSTTSICAADYSANLNYFQSSIVNSLSSIPLECAPVGSVAVTVTPLVPGLTSRVQNNTLMFTPAIPAGYTIDLGYDCPMN